MLVDEDRVDHVNLAVLDLTEVLAWQCRRIHHTRETREVEKARVGLKLTLNVLLLVFTSHLHHGHLIGHQNVRAKVNETCLSRHIAFI